MKTFLIVLLLIGAAFGIPPIRNRIIGPLDPVLSKLGPIGEKIATPAKRWEAGQEATLIIRRISENRQINKPVPTPLTFQGWLKANVRGLKRDGMDPWGHPYYYIHTRQNMTVGSQGQDRLRDTPDDVRITVPSMN
jgi:hypothetical protein